ncbi:MAG: nucleotide exchange factor GrpE [Campylobacterota bacterium]|nr:nucleotide exchange factor GrpE [Campylobacterota bacterium]
MSDKETTQETPKEEVLEEVEQATQEETNKNEENPQEVEAEEVDELAAAQAEALEWKDKYMRAYADFENSKRLMQKDKNTAVAYSNEKFATDILAVIDSFEQALATINAVESEDEVIGKIKEGVDLTYQQLSKVLEKNSIKEIECEGELDPNLHQAIMQVESDEHESGHIVQVLQKGYMIKDRVLRSPMVSTCK